jgi:tellurite resistance-related uncharacterized protein
MMKTLPADARAYKRTPAFTADTVPEGLRSDHRTKDGVWGVLHIVRGTVDYIIGGGRAHTLSPQNPGVIEPQVTHRIRPSADAEFFIEFYRIPEPTP